MRLTERNVPNWKVLGQILPILVIVGAWPDPRLVASSICPNKVHICGVRMIILLLLIQVKAP